MNKSELINAMAEKSKLSKKDTETALNTFIEIIEDTVANGEKIQLIGFGTFERRERAERQGVNPKTKEPLTIPAQKVPHFSAGKAFKEKVNNK